MQEQHYIVEPETTVPTRHGRIRARLYRPDRVRRAVVLVPGVHAMGIDAVQATVSRDIAQLGLTKVRNDEGRLVYALPGAADLRRLDDLHAALRRWMGETAPSGTMLVIKTPRLKAATVARAYHARLAARGGVQPLKWRVVRGKLPPGMVLSQRLGTLTGTPRRAGSFRVTVEARDALGAKSQKTLVLLVIG